MAFDDEMLPVPPKKLSKQKQEIIGMRDEGWTVIEIARQLKITRQRVYQVFMEVDGQEKLSTRE